MTLDEAIKYTEEVAEENQKVVDTHVVFDDVTIDMIYCDDTEVIEEHLANYQKSADEYRQIAGWLRDYKRLLEKEPCVDAVSREKVLNFINKNEFGGWVELEADNWREFINNLPPVTPTRLKGKWIKHTSNV